MVLKGPRGGQPLATDLAEAELRAPADERFEFLIHSFLAGMPDPLPVRVASDVEVIVDVRDDLVGQVIGVE